MKKTWWKEAVIYQIYPRSFKDSNGDGIGDLRGIIEKLDYLKSLGVDVIWLSPIYQSPNDDNGYDISDYYNIMSEFGTMADFDELLEGMHQRGIRLLMDLVVNHTSDEHHWFQESRKSKDNPYRDYYHWKPPVDGGEPNNWLSFFSGSAWQYDETTGEYFLHLFSKKQPDLNWENPKVREEVYQLMRFWLDKGVDGFRMDVIPFISKRLDFPDIDVNDFGKAIVEVYANGPRVHEFLHEMNQETLSRYDAMSVGEGIGVTPETANLYVGEDREELNMVFHFGHMFLGQGSGGRFDITPWKLSEFKDIFTSWSDALGDKGWLNIYLDNHDFPRMVSRFGEDTTYRVTSAKMLMTLLMTLRGTPCIYHGSEIGMTNVAFPSFEDYRDIEIKNAYAEAVENGDDLERLLHIVHENGRDNARTPIQWNSSDYAGFSSVQPWINVNPNYQTINVEQAEADPDSILHFYRKAIQFRKDNLTMVYGEYQDLEPQNEELYIYKRWDTDHQFLVVLNFTSKVQAIDFSKYGDIDMVVLSNYDTEQKALQPWEGRVYLLK